MSTPVKETNLGKGIDAFHVEDSVPEGYVIEGTLNADPTAYGTLKKRAGWQRAGGFLPIRVTKVTRSSTTITFRLPANIDVTGLRSRPIAFIGNVYNPWDGLATNAIGSLSTAPAATWFSAFSVVDGQHISVTDTNSGGTTTVDPDVTTSFDDVLSVDGFIYGLPTDELVSTGRENWVAGLTSFITREKSTPIAVWQRNLYELSAATPYVPSARAPYARGTVSGAQVLGRAFYGSVPSTVPTRGYIASTGADLGYARVVSATYSSGTGYTTYRLHLPAYVASTTLSSIVRAGVDQLHVEQMSWDVLAGDFDVISLAAVDANYIDVVVNNEANAETDARRSDSAAAGRASIETDRLTLTSGARLFPGDELVDDSLFEGLALEVVSATDTTVVISGVGEPLSISNAYVLAARRTARFVPLRASTTRGVSGYVEGDLVTLDDVVRSPRVVNVVTHADDAVTITGDGETAVVSALASTAGYFVGSWIVLWNAGDYTGAHEVSAVDGSTVSFESTVEGTAIVGTALGYTIVLDEEIEHEDASVVGVAARWAGIPLPNPNSQSLEPVGVPHFALSQDPEEQTFPATAQVGGKLYVSNYDDPVLCYDGTEVARAGLPRSASLLFIEANENSIGQIVNPFPYLENGGATEGIVQILTGGGSITVGTATQASRFTAGQDIVVTVGTGISRVYYRTTVENINSTNGIIFLTQPIPSISVATGCNVYREMLFRYYGRLVCYDRAGRKTVGPAFGSQDSTISVGPDAAIHLRFVHLPKLDRYQFDRIVLEVYRTGPDADGAVTGGPPFYLIDAIPLSYRVGTGQGLDDQIQYAVGYIDVIDTTQVSEIVAGATDTVVDALTGGDRIGSGWSEPPRAKILTTAGNRLVAANIQSEPRLDVQFTPGPNRSVIKAVDLEGCKVHVRRNGATANSGDFRDGIDFCFRYSGVLAAGLVDFANAVQVFPFGRLLRLRMHRNTSNPDFTTLVGQWLYLWKDRTNLEQASGGMEFQGWYQIVDLVVDTLHYYDPGYAWDPATWIAADLYVVYRPNSRPVTVTSLTKTGVGPYTVTFVTAYHDYTTGDPLVTSILTASPTGYTDANTGLDNRKQYYAIRVSSTTFRVAESLADAVAGTAITSANATLTISATGLQFYRGYSYPEPGASPENDNYSLVVSTVGVPVVLHDGGFGTEGYGTAGDRAMTSISGCAPREIAKKLAGAIQACAAGSSSWADEVEGETIRQTHWLAAEAGNELTSGLVRLSSPTCDDFTFEFETGTQNNFPRVLVNGRPYRYGLFETSDVSTSSDTISVAEHGLATGTALRFDSATVPTGLTANVQYFAVRLDNSKFGVASSLANALAGTKIDLTSTGSGTMSYKVEEPSAELVFPSRLAISYKNYPELFDDPFAASALVSDSIIDVNPDDGEEIRAVMPFFAESYSAGSQGSNQQGVVIVWKDLSIYAVDIETREVTRIESNEQGLSYPRAVSYTRNGILFANDAGIWKINRSLQVLPQGQIVTRLWAPSTDADTDVPVATPWGVRNRALFAFPSAGETENDSILSYDYSKENSDDIGSWSPHDQPVSTWSTHAGVLYRGGYDGLVYVARTAGDDSDYRDDDAAITYRARLRWNDLGLPGVRKLLSRVTVNFRALGTQAGNVVRQASDLAPSYADCDPVEIEPTENDGLADEDHPLVYSKGFSMPRRKVEFVSIEIENSTLDEPTEVSAVTFHGDPLSLKGTTQARNS